jgi:N-methylhydantoinase A
MRVAVDIGGTFTDVLTYINGRLHAVKLPTVKSDPSLGVIKGLERIKTTGTVVHATTLGTNFLLTAQETSAALITTWGFRDMLEIGRQNRPSLYDLYFQRPKPLIPRRLRFEVSERISSRGEVLVPLDLEEVEALAANLCGRVEEVAVSFLNSYINPVHEELVKRKFQEVCPQIDTVLSSEVDRQMGEFERTSTTVVNAVLKPVISRYLGKLRPKLEKLLVMQSSGGFSSPEEAMRFPAAFIESGPAAGAVGVAHLSKVLGYPNLLGVDIGGTTAKASTVINGELTITSEYEVGGRVHMGRRIKGSGYPLRYPFVDLAEISGGGGTVIWRDKGGALRVGPRSAESEPGPACYGRGGMEPTITDALLTLGRIPDSLAGGEVKLSMELAVRALRPLGDPWEVSLSALEILGSETAELLKAVTLERGLDPSDFTLVAFGGAGPLQAAELAEVTGIREVLIPLYPGLFSAFGLLVSDYRHDFVRAAVGDHERIFEEMEAEARKVAEREGLDQVDLLKFAEVRYLGQSFGLTLPYSKDLETDFVKAYRNVYGYDLRSKPVEVVNLRLTLISRSGETLLKRLQCSDEEPVILGEREVMLREGWTRVPLLRREDLAPCSELRGPVVVESFDSTVLVPPKFSLRVDNYLDLVIRR